MKSKVISIVSFLMSITICICIVWFGMQYIIPSGTWLCIVEGDSMSPTFEDGQIVFSNMTDDVRRGDIVTLVVPDSVDEKYSNHRGRLIIKRIIGLPGENVRIDVAGVYVNEQKLNEDYLTESAIQNTYQENQCNNIQLGEEEYYVLGDNRENSFDSRLMGAIEEKDLVAEQTKRPMKQFWIKLGIVVVLLIVTVVLYFTTEKLLIKVLHLIFSKGKEDC